MLAGRRWDRLEPVTDVSSLIDVTTLGGWLAIADGPTVLDARWRLAGPPGRDDYLAGHIPGAAFVDLDADLCGAPGPGGRHPLPEPADLTRALRAAGVRDGVPVVAYDDGDGVAAARLWWTLRWAGHAKVQVLDGGYAAWRNAGRPVESGTVEPVPGNISVVPGGMPVIDADGAAALARSGVLVDARQAFRFRGESEPVDPVAGHIPDAVNVPIGDLAGPGGQLRPAGELRGRFAEVGIDVGTPVGAYCGSGVGAALTVLALSEAGVQAPALYVGSWSNWVADPARPVATA
jgi:thiosulfate/3-mercaptopyruvate sulfurtransferase